MQFDLFHSHTVDNHTLLTVKKLEQIKTGELKIPLAKKVFAEIKSPHLLYLGGFFHDIAKGRGGSHSKKGSIIAEQFSADHNLPLRDSQLVSWLVQNHLIMSVTAQKKDIHNHQVIKEFCSTVDSIKKLQNLYLLTIADIIATNKALWNGFKEQLLNELYLISFNYINQKTQSYDSKCQAILKAYEGAPEQSIVNQNLNLVPKQVLQIYSQEKLELMLSHPFSNSLAVVKILSKNPTSSEVFISCKDFKGLFFTIVSFFEKQNLYVADAKINSTNNNFAFNTFHLLSESSYISVESACLNLTQELLKPCQNTDQIKRHRSQKTINFPVETQVILHPDEKAGQTKIEIICADKPGLLAQIASILLKSNIEIMTAKIATFGNRVEDTFWISSNNKHLSNEQFNQLKNNIIKNL